MRGVTASAGSTSNELSFNALYREHCAFVQTFVARLLGPGFDAQDLTQEVFMVALKKLPMTLENPRAWLAAIAFGQVANARRNRGARNFFSSQAQAEQGALEHSIDWQTPEQALEGRQAIARLYGILNKLPEKQRSALIMSELQGMAPKEIAAVTGEALTTVYSRLQTARERCLAIHRRSEAQDE